MIKVKGMLCLVYNEYFRATGGPSCSLCFLVVDYISQMSYNPKQSALLGVKSMVRISKQNERRSQSPRKRHTLLVEKSGPKADNLPKGFKEHSNALGGEYAALAFIPKIK